MNTIICKLGVNFKMGVNVGEDISFEKLREKHDAVLIAIGAQQGNLIRIPGNDAKGVFVATDFLKEVNETQHFSGAGKKIMVIGGGDVAMDWRPAVRFAWGSVKVYQCSLESLDILPASKEEREEALEEGVICNFGMGTCRDFKREQYCLWN